MRDKTALFTAVLLALLLFALQHFVKQNLLSPANLETAGKLQRMFQVSGIIGPPEFTRPIVPIAIRKTPARKNPVHACPKHRETIPCAMVPATAEDSPLGEPKIH